jgi:hypothetical protein
LLDGALPALYVDLFDCALLGARRRVARRSTARCSALDGALLGCSVGLHDGALFGARRRGLLLDDPLSRAACASPPGVKFANWLVTRMITLRL